MRRAAKLAVIIAMGVLSAVGLGACGSGPASVEEAPEVVATTTYLADIVRQVAGERFVVESLLPMGSDPHAFEPRPSDARLLAQSRLVVNDTPGLAPMVDQLVESTVQPTTIVLQAASGLAGRQEAVSDGHGHEGEVDPHFWLDPVNVLTYVTNIRNALTALDPGGAQEYQRNAERYSQDLRELDSWIKDQVAQIPPNRRLLVTNHEALGYFADRYGFTVVGTVFRTMGEEGAPSARQLAALVSAVRLWGAPAIFLEIGSNGDLATEVARETGARVVDDLYLHSVADNAPTYVDMMRWNVQRIEEALR